MKHFFILSVSLFIAIVNAYAQDSSMFCRPNHPSALHNYAESSMHLLFDQPINKRELIQGCRHLTLDIDAAGFFFDAEYATPYAKGYTVTGFRLAPALSYGINEKAQLRVGFNATAFAGLDSLYKLRPTFSLIYAPTRWLTLVAGTIYGSNTHQLAPPVYDPSRWIYNYNENGLQILTQTKFWSSDTWLDWTHYLTPWTADQERFTMGSRHTFNILKFIKQYSNPVPPCAAYRIDTTTNNHLTLPWTTNKEKLFSINLPTHFIANHRGGEVKTIDTNTVTTFNERIGIQIKYTFANALKPSFHIFRLDLPLYNYHLEDNTLDHNGKAFYPTISYEWSHWNKYQLIDWNIRAIAGYWHGNHYFSAYGSPLFWSANAYSALHVPASANIASATDIRNIATFTLSAEHEFKGLNLGLQVDALYDLDLKKTDFIFGFYMRFKERFLLF